MFWFFAILSGLVAALLANGLIHQERLRLWGIWQEELAEQKRLALEEKKRQAAEKVKKLLLERKTGDQNETEAAIKEAVLEMSAVAQAEKAHAATN